MLNDSTKTRVQIELTSPLPASSDRRPRPSLKARFFYMLPQSYREAIRRRWMQLEPIRDALWGNMDRFYAVTDAQRFFYTSFKALRFNRIYGDYVEFGSWSGFTFNLAYHQSRRAGYQCRLWSYDSFQGLPEKACDADDHPKWRAGSMSMSEDTFHEICRYNAIPRAAYEVVPGYYGTTLTNVTAPKPEAFSLAYIDCDMYSSTAHVLRFLLQFAQHGALIAFDDWHCWSSTQPSGERRAAYEQLADNPNWRMIPFQRFGVGGMAFVLESRHIATMPYDHTFVW